MHRRITFLAAGAAAAAFALALSGCASGGPVVTEATSVPSETPTPEPVAQVGTRENPAPLGTSAKFSEESIWTFTMGATDADAWPEILATNEFNEPPAAGSTYVLAPVHAALADTEAAAQGVLPAVEFEFEYVTAAGTAYGSITCLVEFPPPVGLLELGSMYGGTETDFHACAAVPIAEIPGGTWKAFSVVDPSENVFFAGV